jgi:phosphoribosyl-ATP pyrophosphohydrolase/phosphoribosyl-AMP cyclohydrolase
MTTTPMNFNVNELVFNPEGLIPVVVQEANTKEVLMLAYMNEEAIQITLRDKVATYYSRSRKALWKKGETSGHIQHVLGLSYDCDSDALLLSVKQIGVACHTNHMSCFFNQVLDDQKVTQNRYVLEELYATIEERKNHPIEGSYTNYLFNKGIDKILKKVGEETAEVIIASKNHSIPEMTLEISDLVYHVMVLMVNEGITLPIIADELSKRRQLKAGK